MTAPATLTAAVIARDEAQRIGRCLATLDFADEIVVVDGASRDDTADVARGLGARVVVHPFDDFASQRNRAILSARCDFVLMVDADEEVTPELRAAILQVLAQQAPAAAYLLPRRNILFGAWLRHGGHWPDWQLRFFRRGAGRYTRPVHERFETREPVARLESPLVHHATATIAESLAKLQRYSALEIASEDAGPPGAATLVLRPAALFLRSYVLRAGFRDGVRGLVACGLAAFYAFVTLVRRWEATGRAGRAAALPEPPGGGGGGGDAATRRDSRRA